MLPYANQYVSKMYRTTAKWPSPDPFRGRRVSRFGELQIEHAAAIEQNAITCYRIDLVSIIQE